MEFIFYFNLFAYGFGFLIIPLIGGIRKNIIYTFYLSLCSIYCFITPYYFYCVNRETIWGNDEGYKGVGVNISDYYGYGLLLYGIAILIFIFVYISFNFINIPKFKIRNYYSPNFKILVIFIISFSFVLLNLFISGLNPINILLGSDDTNHLMGAKTASNYLRNFADTIIICLIIAFYFRMNKKLLWFLISIGFILFLLMGFRYRIIMTLLGIAICYLYQNQLSTRRILKLILGLVLMLYFTLFISHNRINFVKGDLGSLEYNPKNFKSDLIFEQTRGALADFNIMKHYALNPNTPHDYGITNLYFAVRLLPRSIFGELKDNLYPPPAFSIISEAYSLPRSWGRITEAILHYGYFYIGGGIFGVFFGSFLIGLFIKCFKIIFAPITFYNLMMTIIFCQVLFQWVTRGYFPQVVDHFAFLFIGLWLFNKIGTKKFTLKSIR